MNNILFITITMLLHPDTATKGRGTDADLLAFMVGFRTRYQMVSCYALMVNVRLHVKFDDECKGRRS